MTTPKTPITIARGDGIGPEIMDAVLAILDQAEAPLAYEEIQIGEKVYLNGIKTGIEPSAWPILKKNKILLKAPIMTPQGGGYQSLNVAIRKAFGLFANIRPCTSYDPFIKTLHPGMDVVIIRENEEDTYAGIEYQQTDEMMECLKLISRPGCERICRYAFEYALQTGRKKVTCMVKDNIMKKTDGLFASVFREVASGYPHIEAETFIIDIGAAYLANRPHLFEVIVTQNLYGDIISDIAAEVAGSVGLAGSANLGQNMAMFEAIHGCAPLIAGQNIANPSALLQAAVMMLGHMGQSRIAEKIQHAWLKTIEAGLHTADIYTEGRSHAKLGTAAFAQAVIDHLGQKPTYLKPAVCQHHPISVSSSPRPMRAKKQLVGIDVFLHWDEADRCASVLADLIQTINHRVLAFKFLSNRGVCVYPAAELSVDCTDHWCARFVAKPRLAGSSDLGFVTHADVISLLESIQKLGLDFIQTQNLYKIGDQMGFSGDI